MDRKSARSPPNTSYSRPGMQHYRDEEEAGSSRTTRDDHGYEDNAELPSYTDSIAADGAVDAGPSHVPPVDEYKIITPPKLAADAWRNRRSEDKSCSQQVLIGSETTVRMDKRLNDTTLLYDYINDYLRVIQPRPAVRVQGWHWEIRKKDKRDEQERIFDFDVVLSLQPFLAKVPNEGDLPDYETPPNSVKTFRGHWRKTYAASFDLEQGVGSYRRPFLFDWAGDYCLNKSALKIFRVTRHIQGLNTEYIKEQIEPLVRETHYRGHVDVTFPVADKNVDIYSDHWVNRARINPWVRWFCYLTFLWIFTWPILFFMTKRWDVYNVHWRFSEHVYDSEARTDRTVYATISEADWMKRHAGLIQRLVLERFHGDATRFSIDIDASRRRPSADPSCTSSANLDSPVSFIHGDFSAWNTLSGRRGESLSWGADS